MPAQPFHHGNLRAELLVEAERTLRLEGMAALSLRELARRLGVSHGAPRRHFLDRQALLDAVAEQGFHRLAEVMRVAASQPGSDYRDRLAAAAGAFVDFAIEDAALLDLMFAAKNADPPESLQRAAETFFATVHELIAEGAEAGRMRLERLDSLQLLLVATLQGIAALVTSRRIAEDLAPALVADAMTLYLRG